MAQRSAMRRDDVRLDELRSTPAGTGQNRLSRRQLALALGTATGLVGGAWAVGGRLSIAELGMGGVARSYLPQIGDEVPPLGMYDPEGKVVFLSGFRGQPVWINFWGSWCPPCQAEFPEIEAAYRALAPRGLVLLAISVRETWEQADAFARAHGGTFPIYNIPDMTVFGNRWDVRNFPTHLYLDPSGTVRDISIKPGSESELIAAGERALSGI